MAGEGFKRKLTAIFNVYVQRCGWIMGEDERSTVRTLNAFLTSTSFK